MNRNRVIFWVLSEKPHNFGTASAAVPRNEGDIRREPVSLHKGQKFLKIHKAMSRLQHGIINHQTGVRLGRIPAGLCKGPFYIKGKRHCTEEMVPYVKIF